MTKVTQKTKKFKTFPKKKPKKQIDYSTLVDVNSSNGDIVDVIRQMLNDKKKPVNLKEKQWRDVDEPWIPTIVEVEGAAAAARFKAQDNLTVALESDESESDDDDDYDYDYDDDDDEECETSDSVEE